MSVRQRADRLTASPANAARTAIVMRRLAAVSRPLGRRAVGPADNRRRGDWSDGRGGGRGDAAGCHARVAPAWTTERATRPARGPLGWSAARGAPTGFAPSLLPATEMCRSVGGTARCPSFVLLFRARAALLITAARAQRLRPRSDAAAGRRQLCLPLVFPRAPRRDRAAAPIVPSRSPTAALHFVRFAQLRDDSAPAVRRRPPLRGAAERASRSAAG